jgi:hypothetical protein
MPMTEGAKVTLGIALVALAAAILVALPFIHLPHRKPIWLKGAVIVKDSDPGDRRPIAGVEIIALGDGVVAAVKSDSSGYFVIQLPTSVRRGRAVTLQFRHPEYQPLDVNEFVVDKLYIAEMEPLARKLRPNDPEITVGSLRIRYSLKAMTVANIGSAAKPFQVVNAGNVPCKGQPPCSPDGKWKAAIGSAFLDAGAGNEFRNSRVSCIAGPCPFTKIEKDDFSKGGQTIRASARNWSDTTTFLLEAEVFHPMISEIVHESQPVIFGRTLDFTLPASAEGVCIEADVSGQTIIYPLGPALFLSWANCDVTVNRDQTKVYRCNLKAGYHFPATSSVNGGLEPSGE